MTDRRTPWTPAYTVALNQVPSDRQDAEKLAGEIWKAACVSYPAGPEPQLRTREPDSPASAPPSSEFHLFPRLPIELQDNIWTHAVRAVDPIMLQSAQWARWIPRERLPYESYPAGDSSNKTVLVVGLPARMRSIPLYWACHAARRAAVAAYGDPAQGDIIFNPDVDYVQCAGDHDDPSQDFQQGFRLLYGAEDGDTLWLHHLRPYLNREVFHISRTAPDGKRARQLYWHSASAQDVVEDPPAAGPSATDPGNPTYLFGVSPALQERVRHVCISVHSSLLIKSFNESRDSRDAPEQVARGLEFAVKRFPAIETLTVRVHLIPAGRSRRGHLLTVEHILGPAWLVEAYQLDPQKNKEVPAWWTDFVTTVIGAGRQMDYPPGLRTISFVRRDEPTSWPALQ